MHGVQHNYDLTACNTLSVPAMAEHYAAPTDKAGLRACLDFARSAGLSITVMGAGSNVVLPKYLKGLVVSPRFSGIEVLERTREHVVISVGAGEDWSELVRHTLRQGWYGLENLATIPGSVGAAPVQNIGAYGTELARFVLRVVAIDALSGTEETYDNADCDFAYRQSIFRRHWRDRKIIIAVHLRLATEFKPNTTYESLRAYLRARDITELSALAVYRAVATLRRRLPDVTREPNVGSFFLNPEMDESAYRGVLKLCPDVKAWSQPLKRMRISAADLLERCGWRDKSCAGVRVHKEHALVIVNDQHRSGADVMHCATAMHVSVLQRFGVDLEIEPRVLV